MNNTETMPDAEHGFTDEPSHDEIFADLDAAEALTRDVQTAEDEKLVQEWKTESTAQARQLALEAANAQPMPKLVEHSGAIVTETARDEQLAAGQQAGSGSYDGRARY